VSDTPDDDRAQLIATIIYRGDTEEIEYVYPGEEGAAVSQPHRQRDGLFPPECACGLPWPCPVAERDELRAALAQSEEMLGACVSNCEGQQERAQQAEAALKLVVPAGDAMVRWLERSYNQHAEALKRDWWKATAALRDAPAEQPEAGEQP